jgi:hypothetical protein
VTTDDSPPPKKRVDWRVRGGIVAALLVTGVVILAQDWWTKRQTLAADLREASAAGADVVPQESGVPQEGVDAHAQRLERTHGIRIRYGDPADFWAPPYLAEDVITAPWLEIKPADPRTVATTLNGVEAALQQYPPGFVAKLIKAVFICGLLRMQGEYAAGTNGRAWIIMASRAEYGLEGLRELGFVTFHHELSSFVLRQDVTTWSKWIKFAPADRHYAEDPAGAIRGANQPDPPLETGFLNAYGATNLENDFNIYAEEMFNHPQYMAALAQKYPLIRRKLDFVLATYVAIDPAFKPIFLEMGLTGS